MFPDRNPYGGHDGYGGYGRSMRGFQPTFMTGSGSSRRQGSSQQVTSSNGRERSSRSNAQPAQGGRTIIVQPGQPHYFSTRTDFRNCRYVSNMCRCQNPDSQGDAWTIELGGYEDRAGRPITYQTLMHRIVDHYGTPTVSNEQEVAAYRILASPSVAELRENHERNLRWAISMGVPVVINPHAESVTFHNGVAMSRTLSVSVDCKLGSVRRVIAVEDLAIGISRCVDMGADLATCM
jgi:hypothetical protein